ncbi:hypothetical protein HHI36_013152 [Cryptolaemus montrouzieri]|uniref:Uncharacterized protein n=1 Tax=Cryptolaemus montrouzieri TaxID=559131 RepID=A0ABD2NGW4_9CUCU
MANKFNQNYLRSEELCYEITIRGEAPPASVEDRRRMLRGLLAQETGNRSFNSIEVPFSLAENSEGVSTSLKQLEDLVKKFNPSQLAPRPAQISTKMTYLSGRIFRLKPETPDDTVLKHQLRTRLLELEGEFAERMEPKDEDPLLNNIPASQSTPLRSSNNFSGNLSIKKVPVFKWGLKKFN